MGAARPAQRDDQGARHGGRNPRDRGAHRPRRQREHHAAVLRCALRAGDRRLPRGPRAPRWPRASRSTRSPRWPRSSSRASTPRSTPLLPADSALRGRVAIANAQRAYAPLPRPLRRTDPLACAERARAPARNGPCGPAPATKDPAYSDVLYVEELIAPDVVNTMPEATLRAFADHGDVRPAAFAPARGRGDPSPRGTRGHRPRRDHRRARTRGRALLLRLLPRAARLHRDQAAARTRGATKRAGIRRVIPWRVMEGSLTHLDASGQATMVDVGGKAATDRRARAHAVVRMSPTPRRASRPGTTPRATSWPWRGSPRSRPPSAPTS